MIDLVDDLNHNINKNMKKLVLKTLFEEDKYAQWLKFVRLEMRGYSFLELKNSGQQHDFVRVKFSFLTKSQKNKDVILKVNYKLVSVIHELEDTVDLEKKVVYLHYLNYEIGGIKFKLVYNKSQGISKENTLFKEYLGRLPAYKVSFSQPTYYNSIDTIYNEFVLRGPLFKLIFNNEEDKATIKSKILTTIENEIKTKQSDKKVIEDNF